MKIKFSGEGQSLSRSTYLDISILKVIVIKVNIGVKKVKVNRSVIKVKVIKVDTSSMVNVFWLRWQCQRVDLCSNSRVTKLKYCIHISSQYDIKNDNHLKDHYSSVFLLDEKLLVVLNFCLKSFIDCIIGKVIMVTSKMWTELLTLYSSH